MKTRPATHSSNGNDVAVIGGTPGAESSCRWARAIVLAGIVSLVSCDDAREWRMGVGGDTLLARGVQKVARLKNDPGAAFGDMAPLMRELDLMFCNLECQIADVGSKILDGEKSWYFRAAPAMVQALESTGVDVVTVANNHGMDYGPDALLQTISLCRDSGIVAVGGGHDIEEASAPGVVNVAGRRVAFVGANMTDPLMSAGKASPGLNAFDLQLPEVFLDSARASLERANRVADVVMFTVHWGPNYAVAPTERQRYLAHQLLDMGYAGILGHSAHQFHGIEVYNGKPIIYDAGNFAVDFFRKHWNDRNMLFILHFRGDDVVQVEARPIFRKGRVTRFAESHVAGTISRRLVDLSARMGTIATQTSDHRVIVEMDQSH